MAFTLGSHIILACLGVGLPVLMLAAEWKYIRTGEQLWKTLATRWSKSFAVLFAVGAVSGTVLSFELGLLWPKFMGTFGSVISLPFTLEGFAFFFEAIFVGIYIYGWDRLSPVAHLLSGIPIAVSGFASAWFVVTANAWMNSPQGFVMVDGQVTNAQPIVAMFNAATWAQTTHMILAAYLVSGFCVASFYAYCIARGNNSAYNRRACGLGLTLGMICILPQLAAGDWSAKVVAKTQPIKFAAMESHFETEKGASLLIGGIPDVENRKVSYGIKIPRLLSFLAHGDLNAEVKGLEEFPTEEIPPVPIVHYAFQVMVFAGIAMLLFSITAVWRWARKREAFFQSKLFLCLAITMGPLAVLALETGWVVTEVGRQPWIVYGFMRTADAVTGAEGILEIFMVTIAIYLVMFAGCFIALRRLANKPIESASTPSTDQGNSDES